MSGGWTYRPGPGAAGLLAALAAGVDRGVMLGGEQVLTVSNQRVPLDEGTLERSGAVSQPQDGRVTVSYSTVYAARQHEELGWQHRRGQAKYLESAMHDSADTVAQLAATAIRKSIGT